MYLEERKRSYVFKPIKDTVEELNVMLAGWANYFSIGFCAPAYKAVDGHVFYRLVRYMKRRSQRAYRCPKDRTWHKHILALGYNKLGSRLRPCVS